GSAVLDDAEGRLRALAHYLAELAGEDQPSPSRHARCLNEQDIASDGCPGKTCCHARDARTHRQFAFELSGPKHSRQVVDVDADRPACTLRDAHGSMAQSFTDLALKGAHARFAGVSLDDLA